MTLTSELVFPFLLAGFLSSFLASLIDRISSSRIHLVYASISFLLFLYFFTLVIRLPLHGSFFSITPWTNYGDIHFYFRLDGFSLLFSLLISFMGFLVFTYSGRYLRPTTNRGRFYCLLMLFMISMLGLVLADHLLILFLFWELTTFSSFLLIGFDHHKPIARENAWKAILVTTFGALFMLAGFILLGEVTGTFRISEMLEKSHLIIGSPYYISILTLIFLGAFTKSAQFPFSFWLPSAMVAPTPISAYLHSVTMVKAGIYLLGRFLPILGGTNYWFFTLTIIGSITMLTGIFKALLQDDLKLILAYLTIVVLGVLTLLLGIGDTNAVKAFMLYLVVHSCYKGSLFLAVGAIDLEKGTRKISEISGLFHQMPYLSVATILSILSMISFPFTLGMISKELVYKASFKYAPLIGVIILSMALAISIGITLVKKLFWGQKSGARIKEKISLWIPSFFLAFMITVGGMFPTWIESRFMKSVVSSISGENFNDVIFPGVKWDIILAATVLTIVLGLVFFLFDRYVKQFVFKLFQIFSIFAPENVYLRLHPFVPRIGRMIEYISLRGYYHKYFSITLFATILLISLGLWPVRSSLSIPIYNSLNIYEWGLIGIILVSTLGSILITNLIASVMLLGVMGFTIAIIFVSYGAPDLALTQLFIETLTIILFALIAIKFPLKAKHHFSSVQTQKDALLALMFGSLMTIVLWAVTSEPFDRSLSRYFNENSYLVGKGRNVVNVILVDFRALDTLGEITVLSIAGIGFFSLLKLSLRRKS